MSRYSAHIDTFARDNLPPRDAWPELINLDRLGYPDRLNAAVELLDKAVLTGHGPRPCLASPDLRWTYAELLDNANRIARVLTEELNLRPGERVLLRAPNNPMMVACWFAVIKAGGIAVSTMPLLRSRELEVVVDQARIRLALCDERLGEELDAVHPACDYLERVVYFNGDDGLSRRMRHVDPGFDNVDTAADDVCLIAFTSGTTGRPKGTMHFHRDLLAVCDTFSRQVLRPGPDDVFIGSPPLAFTFGLGGLVLFPFRDHASTVLLEQASPAQLSQAIETFRATTLFTSPTAYRVLTELAGQHDFTSLRAGVSAGETLPLAVYEDWQARTGIKLIDALGSTEMLHVFISAAGDAIRPGATGKPIPLYQARVVDAAGDTLPAGEIGRLAVRGPTGCRYLNDPRQSDYVQQGWNITGDAYRMDADGYYWFQSRIDDMIVSAGYNIAGPEVEDALLSHPAVAECAVIGVPHEGRGQIVKAYVILRPDAAADPQTLTESLQEHVKRTIAPYKYPRAVEFVTALPRTETGKIQRFRLRTQIDSKR